MSVSLVDLETLHRQAEARPLDVDALPWAAGVRAGSWLAPEAMSHLFHCPSYAMLKEEERREAARSTALTKAESFVYFEEFLLVPIVEALLANPVKYRLTPTLCQCLRDFVAEERLHTEMFWRLLETAAPDRYPTRTLHHYGHWTVAGLFARVLSTFPGFFIFWVWLALVIEERTVDLYRQYRADDRVDPLFAAVYHAHMVDETRHVSIDQHLLAAFWDPAPLWLRRLNVALLDHVLGKVTTPAAAPRAALAAVLACAPHLREHRDVLERELSTLGRNPSYQAAHFSRACLPRTFALMDRYPEMASLGQGLPAYESARA